jgi:hypothetical protein
MIIKGVDSILSQGDSYVFCIQSQKRWVFKDGIYYIGIKTIGGGQNENESDLETLSREISEEIIFSNIVNKNICKDSKFITNIKIPLKDISIVNEDNGIVLNGNFYNVLIDDDIQITPNDIPCLLKIPKSVLSKTKFYPTLLSLDEIDEYLIIGKDTKLPKKCKFFVMLPETLRNILFP